MGAWLCRNPSEMTENSETKGPDDEKASGESISEDLVENGRDCKVPSGASAAGDDRGEDKNGKSTGPDSDKQAGATTAQIKCQKVKGRKTRFMKHSDHQEKVREEREKSLKCGLEEKRKLYACGEGFYTLDDILTWPQYFKLNIEDKLGQQKKNEKSSDLHNESQKKGEEMKVDYPVDDELNSKMSIWTGSITALEIDCIVNAANSSLLGGGGVDGAIHRAAGSQLLNECKTLYGCETGQEKDTAGYRLPAKYVIHTVGPIGEKPQLLQSCYYNCLQKMLTLGQKTIAFPCISTGAYGYPNERAIHVVLETVRHWLEDLKERDKLDDVERVIFCLFLPDNVECYSAWMTKYFPLAADTLPGGTGDTDGSKETQLASADTSQHTTAGDETSNQQNKQDDVPLKLSTRQKEIAAEDSKEMESQQEEGSDGQKLKDSKLETRTVEQENIDPDACQQKELHDVRMSDDSESARTCAHKDAGGESKQTSSEQEISEQRAAERDTAVEKPGAAERCEVKTEMSGEQGQSDAKLQHTDERHHTPSHL